MPIIKIKCPDKTFSLKQKTMVRRNSEQKTGGTHRKQIAR
jgi:hypothetical protein